MLINGDWRVPRIRLRSLMLAVAILAIVLGLGFGWHRRARRLEALALQFGRVANRLENVWDQQSALPATEPDLLMEQIHWHDSVATAYRQASSRPWIPFDPDPAGIECACGYHVARRTASRDATGSSSRRKLAAPSE